MSKSTPENPRVLIITTGYADIVLEAVQAAKMSTFTPAQQEKLPGLLRELGRYVVAPTDEIQEELIDLRKRPKPVEGQERRKRGRPPLSTR